MRKNGPFLPFLPTDSIKSICLQYISRYKYLGVIFTSRGITNEGVNTLNEQAKKALLSLVGNMKAIGRFPPASALRVFHTSITPILHYASEVWGYMTAPNSQVTLNRYCKNILGVKLSTSNQGVAGELGQYPLIIFRKINMLKYWLKIIKSPRQMYRYKLYSFLKQHHNGALPGNCKNWSNEIRKILVDIGCEYLWYNEDLANDSLIGHAHQTLIDLYINEWRNSLMQSRKLESYRVYKHNFCHEQYLLTIKSYKHRRALTCLRLSSHNLEIEVGRYQPRRPRDLRHCSNCDTADVEDEYHFTMVCTQYSDLRRKFIPSSYWRRPNMMKFIDLMSTPEMQIPLAKFIYQANLSRQP